ncbi:MULTISPECIES: hypothetical protein [Bradyrhizobium]|uniref:Uncharacterized protein n=2 Tax=Bradyrhizobium TaxID=374 RepID=A0A7Y4GSD5_9BRAD|nr:MULTISPECIES: hypothetical protein [Bradyrhizobium]NOJ41125.1 hypothetical protein [Bradyrhizobium australiense]NOJ50111.1 hypothetical protein [Bradyrhizobium archetypum]
MTDEQRELERCKQGILRLTQLVAFLKRQVVQLSEIIFDRRKERQEWKIGTLVSL